MSTDKILSSKADGVGILTFNNPERRNAVSPEMSQAAAEVLEDFPTDKAIRVIVLTGRGRQGVRVRAPTSRSSKPAARRRSSARNGTRKSTRFRELLAQRRQADHRHDPRLLRRRRPGHRA